MPSAQSNTSEFEDEFGGNLFDEVDFSHPDEVRLDNSITDVSMETPVRQSANSLSAQAASRQQPNRVASMPNVRQFSGGPQPNGHQARPQAPPQTFSNNQPPNRMMPPPQQANNNNNHSNQNGFRSNPSSASDSTTTSGRPITPPEGLVTPSEVPAHVPSGFISGATAAALTEKVPEAGAIPAIKAFDPHQESPSIRRTQGIDVRKSGPIKRVEVGVPTMPIPDGKLAMNGAGAAKSNFVNPGMDASRRVGMPGGMQQSPLANRSAYKPPAMKRPLPSEASAGRPPLADIGNVQQQTDGASEAKKLKMEGVAAADVP
jgi:DNA repair and recombination protein RAD52